MISDEEILDMAARLRALEWLAFGDPYRPRNAREVVAWEVIAAHNRQRGREMTALMVAVKAVVNAQYAAAEAAGRPYP